MGDYIQHRLDVCGMLEDLYEMSRSVWHRWGKQNQSSNDAWAVADYRTIGITVGRQCGATRGALTWVKRNAKKCVFITKDSNLKKAHISNYVNLEHGEVDDAIWLSPSVKDSLEFWTKAVDEVKHKIEFVIVDDSAFTINTGFVKRSDFNKWVSETFGPDTFVILIK